MGDPVPVAPAGAVSEVPAALAVDPVVVRETATILEAHMPMSGFGDCACGKWFSLALAYDERKAVWRDHVASVLAGMWEDMGYMGTLHRLYRRVPQQPGDAR